MNSQETPLNALASLAFPTEGSLAFEHSLTQGFQMLHPLFNRCLFRVWAGSMTQAGQLPQQGKG